MNRKCKGGNVLIKLDMTKATTGWNGPYFLKYWQDLVKKRWISYVRSMFTNCWFSVLYNGSVHGKIVTGTKAGRPAGSKFLNHS